MYLSHKVHFVQTRYAGPVFFRRNSSFFCNFYAHLSQRSSWNSHAFANQGSVSPNLSMRYRSLDFLLTTLCLYVPFHNVLPTVKLEAALSTALHIRTQSSPRVSRTCVSLYPNQIFSENDLVTFHCWLQHNVSCGRGQNQIFSSD